MRETYTLRKVYKATDRRERDTVIYTIKGGQKK